MKTNFSSCRIPRDKWLWMPGLLDYAQNVSSLRVAVLYRKRMDMDNIVLYRKRMDMDKYFDAERSLRITGRDLCSLLIDKDKLHLSRPAFLGQNHHRRKKLHNKSFILVNLYCSGELFIPFCITRE